MDRPDNVPESANPAFGGALWADGNDLYIPKGRTTLTPSQIRGMSDHLKTRKALQEFWVRYLKDEGLGEAVVDWLMPVDMRPPMVGNLLPPDQDEVTAKAKEVGVSAHEQIVRRITADAPADRCPCWTMDAGPGGYCQRCGHLLTCENCCHKNVLPRVEVKSPRKVVASTPVQLEAQVGAVPPNDVQREAENYDRPNTPVVHRPDLPRCACGSGLPEHEGKCPACYPVAAEAEAIEQAGQMAIVKATPVAVVREEDRWWDDPEAMDTLKGVIGCGATDFQARWMMWFCRGMRLNPFAGEASWSSLFGRPVIDVSGYRAHANRRPEFRRMLSGKVYEGEPFSYNPMTGVLVHEIGMDQDPAKFLFAYAIVYRMDRDSPTFVTQSMKEFLPGWKPWSGDTGSTRKQAAKSAGFDAFPADKLQAKAERKALAKAFSLGGLSEDDIRDGDTGE